MLRSCVLLLAVSLAVILAAPILIETTTVATTTTASAVHTSHHNDKDIQGLPQNEEGEPFFADEEANWEAYAESLEQVKQEEQAFDAEYQRYLDEMAEAMVNDKNLRDEILKELSNIATEQELSKEDVELLKIAQHLYDEEIRSETDEQERQLVEKQRRMARRENEHELNVPVGADDYDFHDADQELWDDPEAHKDQLRKIAEKAFVEKEVDAALGRTADPAVQMDRELRFREDLAREPNQEKREALLRAHKDELETLKHSEGHHPGSKLQLQEVWNDQDGLKDEAFDPTIFFLLHDLNGDGYLDIKELEAIFYNEARKLHDIKGNVDEVAVLEEMRRMREHVEKETDTNQDGLISADEFSDMTKRTDFSSDPSWTALVPEFTEEKLKEFESRRRAARLKDRSWTDDGTHIDHALLEATRRLEMELWKQKHGRQPIAAELTQEHPAKAAEAHHEQPAQEHHEKPAEHHEQPAQEHHEPAAQAHHEQPAAAAEAHHDKPAEHHEQPAHDKAAETHHEQPAQEHHEKPAEHHEQPAQAHHEPPAHDKPAEAHHEQAAPAAHLEKAAEAHHDKPAETHHDKPAEAHHEQPAPAHPDKAVEAHHDQAAAAHPDKAAEVHHDIPAEVHHEKPAEAHHEQPAAAQAHQDKPAEAHHDKAAEGKAAEGHAEQPHA